MSEPEEMTFPEGSDHIEIVATAERDALNVDDLMSLVAGASIKNIAFSDDGNLSFHLSDGRLVTVGAEGNLLHISLDLMAEGSSHWKAPILLYGDEPTGSGAADALRGIAAIVDLAAFVILLEDGRESELDEFLTATPSGDVSSLLDPQHQVHLVSYGTGSKWMEFKAKAKNALLALKLIVMSGSKQGREIAFRRWEAQAKIDEQRAQQEAYRTDEAKQKAKQQEIKTFRDEIEAYNSIIDLYERKILPLPKDSAIRIGFEERYALAGKQLGLKALPAPTIERDEDDEAD